MLHYNVIDNEKIIAQVLFIGHLIKFIWIIKNSY